MAITYSQVKKGAQGSSVSELQKLLNQNGYSLEVDGIFGSNTQAAVRDYQSKNGLAVDGIVGDKTWSTLLNSSSKGSTSNLSNQLANYEGNRPTYTPSQAVNDAANILAQYEANKPGAYESNYAQQIQGVLDQILNREAFSYDFASDPMYQQYADRYQQQGKLAMMDAMGSAAALTGGYGSSYGQQVGQQTYQGYMQGLNDMIPELRNAAYQMYRDEGDKMLTELSLLQGMDENDYGRYRDDVSDYYSDLNYHYNKYNDMSDREYQRYLNDLSAWQEDRDYYYGKQQDAQAQANWEKEFNFASSQSSKKSGSGSSSGKTKMEDYSTVKAYLDEMYAGGATPDELHTLLYGVGNISDDDFEKLQAYIDILSMNGARPGSASPSAQDTSSRTPRTYEDFMRATGNSVMIMTDAEFKRRKASGASELAKYSSYQDYLDEMYSRFS